MKIPVFEEFEYYKHPGYAGNLNQQVIYKFDNGFGASVILGLHSYGLEMMLSTPYDFDRDYVKEQLMRIDEDLFYDVVGHMTTDKMRKLLLDIQNIKPFRGLQKEVNHNEEAH